MVKKHTTAFVVVLGKQSDARFPAAADAAIKEGVPVVFMETCEEALGWCFVEEDTPPPSPRNDSPPAVPKAKGSAAGGGARGPDNNARGGAGGSGGGGAGRKRRRESDRWQDRGEEETLALLSEDGKEKFERHKKIVTAASADKNSGDITPRIVMASANVNGVCPCGRPLHYAPRWKTLYCTQFQCKSVGGSGYGAKAIDGLAMTFLASHEK